MKIDEQWVKDNPKKALDLPVKFAEFIRKHVRSSTTNEYMWNYKGVLYTDEQLYQYWITNIYKPNH